MYRNTYSVSVGRARGTRLTTSISPLKAGERIVKRILDVVLASAALLILAPLVGLIAAVLRLSQGRPVVLRQRRVGENGREFEMLKFRTMVKNAEQLRHLVEGPDSGGYLFHKRRSDPRVTPIGQFLRRYSLDELPQLLNVLLGEMSLVGPRPELPGVVGRYQPWQRRRLTVPPGLTGWWQITCRADQAMDQHTEIDLFYVDHYSLWMDIRILAQTPWSVLVGRGAY